MFEAENGNESIVFERQGVSINCLSWMYNMSGDFITTSEKIGALRIWNASQKSSKTVIKTGSLGIQQFECFKSFVNWHAIVFTDGSIAVFDLKKKKTIWKLETAHSETVFSLEFKPNNFSILATGSYDENIKIWNMDSMKQISSMSQPIAKKFDSKDSGSRVVYCLSWAPGEDSRFATSHPFGDVNVWDYQKGKIVAKIHPGGDGSIYRIEWNQQNSQYIACGSSDNLW